MTLVSSKMLLTDPHSLILAELVTQAQAENFELKAENSPSSIMTTKDYIDIYSFALLRQSKPEIFINKTTTHI